MKKVKKKPPMKIDGKQRDWLETAVKVATVLLAVIEIARFILDYLI